MVIYKSSVFKMCIGHFGL